MQVVVNITMISHTSLCVEDIKTVRQITMKDCFERATLVLKSVGYIMFNPVIICPRHITCLLCVGGGGEDQKKKKLHQVPAFVELMNSRKYPNQMGK